VIARRAATAALLRLAPLPLALACCARQEPMAFDRPTAVVYDGAADRYLVANAAGYVARVAADGTGERDWLRDGVGGVTLRAPRGMALTGELLWVADGATLRSFDRETGEVRGAVEIDGATRLEDVSVAPDGVVYCCDGGVDERGEATGTDAIWRIVPNGEVTALIGGEALGQPTAIVARSTGVYCVNRRDGAFFLVDATGARTELGKAPQGGLTGLVRYEPAAVAGEPARPVWLATCEPGRCVYRFELSGRCTAMPVRLERPAAPAVDRRRGLLVVPLVGENRLHSLRL